MIPELHIEDFNYPLPDSRIAKYPLDERDSSKLLLYNDGEVTESVFRNLPQFLPEGALMVFNDTKVVPARMHFRRESGARIEVFCLEPVAPVEYNLSFAADSSCSWKCVIGNSKRWRIGESLVFDTSFAESSDEVMGSICLTAKLVSIDAQTGVVEFAWLGGIPFSSVLEKCGNVPIPPYLNRETEQIDLERYQTLYACERGSVAAPTAGLHFTERVLSDISAKGISERNVCLHVGAGTFLPVKSSSIADHPMHREPFSVSAGLIREILALKRPLIAVGTTSVRTLESLYYVGVSIIETGAPAEVDQWAPYARDYSYSTAEALEAILGWLDTQGLTTLCVGTRIIIVPGFKFRLVDMLVTNFHQPESTLILLVSAFLDGDWRKVYDYALAHDFRFLSYGDSSLLFRNLSTKSLNQTYK